MALPPIPAGFVLDESPSGLPPIPEGFSLDSGGEPAAETDKPSFNVDLKSRKAKAQYQLESLKNNPDFAQLPKAEQDRLLKSAGQKVSMGSTADRATRGVTDTAMEIPRFLGDTGAFIGNAIGYGLKSAASAGQGVLAAGSETLRTGSLEDGLNKGTQMFAEKQKEYTPSISSPMKPSDTTQALGEALQPAANWIDTNQSDPELSMKLMNLMALTPLKAKAAKISIPETAGKVYGAGKNAASKVADLAVEKVAPASWTPDGTPTTKGTPSMTDSTQTRLNRIREKSPEVIDNRFRNSSEQLTPAERMSADPLERAKLEEKAQIGLDNVEQLAKEGAIHEHNARGEVVLDEAGQPKPYEVGKGGVVAAVRPAMQALDSVWNEVKTVLRKATNKDAQIPTDGVKGLEKFGKRLITPEELQAEISALNEVLYKTKDGVLSLEDTAKRNVLKKSVGEMNALLDDAVAKALDDGTPGTKDLHKQWGGVRHFADAVLNGAERKLAGGLTPTVGDVPVHGGLTYKAVGATTRLMNKFFKNPDKAFEAMIRARRAQGNNVRQRVAPEVGPVEPMLRDPSTGVLSSGVREMGGVVSRNVGPNPPISLTPDKTSGGAKAVPDVVVARFEAALLGKAADKILKIRAKEMGFNSVEEAIAAIDLSRQGGVAPTEMGKAVSRPEGVEIKGYHGGPAGLDRLIPQENGLGGVYLSLEKFPARQYQATLGAAGDLYTVKTTLKNPKYVPSTWRGIPKDSPRPRGSAMVDFEEAAQLRAAGHDALIGIDPLTGKMEEIVLLSERGVPVRPKSMTPQAYREHLKNNKK